MKLSDIRKLCDEATPGPWRPNACHGSGEHHGCGPDIPYDDDELFPDGCYRDAKFIAASRTLMPKLLAVAEAALAHQQICEDQGESLQRLSEALWGVEE